MLFDFWNCKKLQQWLQQRFMSFDIVGQYKKVLIMSFKILKRLNNNSRLLKLLVIDFWSYKTCSNKQKLWKGFMNFKIVEAMPS